MYIVIQGGIWLFSSVYIPYPQLHMKTLRRWNIIYEMWIIDFCQKQRVQLLSAEKTLPGSHSRREVGPKNRSCSFSDILGVAEAYERV